MEFLEVTVPFAAERGSDVLEHLPGGCTGWDLSYGCEPKGDAACLTRCLLGLAALTPGAGVSGTARCKRSVKHLSGATSREAASWNPRFPNTVCFLRAF